MSAKSAVMADPGTTLMSEDVALNRAEWRPKWTVAVSDSDSLGIAIDDGCFVILYRHGDAWRPGTHIPKQAADRIAELVRSGALN